MSIYDDMQGIAAELLKGFRQGVIKYIDIAVGSGPPDDPGPSTETLYDLDAAARGVSFRYVQSGLAIASDLQLTMSVRSDVTPSVKGFVLMDGVRFKIVEVIRKPAAGTPVVFTLIFRK